MRPIDITRLYQDYGVSTAPPGSKHYLSGWVNTHCPFCKGASHHLGYHEQTGHFNCWKCGFKPVFFALSGVLKQHSSKIRALVRLYYRKEDTLEHDPETIDNDLLLRTEEGTTTVNSAGKGRGLIFSPDIIEAHSFLNISGVSLYVWSAKYVLPRTSGGIALLKKSLL